MCLCRCTTGYGLLALLHVSIHVSSFFQGGYLPKTGVSICASVPMTACAGPTAGSAGRLSSTAAWLKASSAAAIAALSSASSLALALWLPAHSVPWTSLTFLSSNTFLSLLSTSSCRTAASFVLATFRSSISLSLRLLDLEYHAFFPTFTIGLTT